jgi:hypothetical protein
MTARNDITGDAIQTKSPNDAYREGWDRIFGKKHVFNHQNDGGITVEQLTKLERPGENVTGDHTSR